MTLHISQEELAVRVTEQRKNWKQSNPERVKEHQRKHCQKEEVKARKLEWSRNNAETINTQRREAYRLKKLTTDQSLDTKNDISMYADYAITH